MAKKVLVIEDDYQTLQLIEFLLRRAGFEILSSADGEEGVKKLLLKPDLIITDIMLPKMGGLEVIEKIKDNVNTRKIPILILSALGQEEFVSAALKKGADEYIIKPFSTGFLTAEVKRLLETV